MDLLSLAVGIGLVTGLLFTEIFGLATGGLIVPGYMALYLNKPLDIVATIGAAFLTFGIVRVLSSFMIVYGRRRTALMILVGYIIGILATQIPGTTQLQYEMIGFVIPGLIAIWMDRQGILQTLSILTIVSIVVRLILILVVGQEALS